MSNDRPSYEELLIENENLKSRLSESEDTKNSTQSKLHFANQQLEMAIKSGLIGVWDWNLLTGVATWNDIMFEIYGMEKVGHVSREKWMEKVHPEDSSGVCDSLGKVIKDKIHDSVEFRIKLSDTTIKYIYAAQSPVLDDAKEVVRIVGVNIDITKRKLTEQSLKESEEKYRTLVQFSGDPIFCFNPDETYRFVNEAFAKVVGKATEDIIGKTPHPIFGYEEGENRLKLVRQVFKSGQKGEIEVDVVLPSGEKAYFVTIADPVIDEHGNICWVSCISKNITARKEAELLIKKQNIELQKLNADKDRFLAILAHDLRGPFHSILWLLDLLARNLHEYGIDKIEKYIVTVNSSAKTTYRLLEDVLLWIRANSGKIPYEPQKLSFATIYRDMIINITPKANYKGITINYLESENISVFADVNMLQTILRNLVSNAVKFTDTGGVINISCIKDREMATFTISDNGIGIAPEIIDKLFDLSELYTTKGTDDESGTGLGLLICKEFVEKHGGKIWVESEVGKGCDFKFTLPCLE